MGLLRLVVLALASACSTGFVYACGFDGLGAAGVPEDAGPRLGEAGGEPGDASASRDASDAGDASFDFVTARSCKEIVERDPATRGKSGAYSPELFCEMEFDNGGWTLVGRSASNGAGAFGWTSRAGTIADLTKPYSKDVAGAGFAFSEILITDKPPLTRAYKLPVPVDFLTAHPNNRLATNGVVTLLGNCTPDPAKSMFKFIGETARTNVFFFRDVNSSDQLYGLRPDGWSLAYADDCERAGLLDNKQGFIFVR